MVSCHPEALAEGSSPAKRDAIARFFAPIESELRMTK